MADEYDEYDDEDEIIEEVSTILPLWIELRKYLLKQRIVFISNI